MIFNHIVKTVLLNKNPKLFRINNPLYISNSALIDILIAIPELESKLVYEYKNYIYDNFKIIKKNGINRIFRVNRCGPNTTKLLRINELDMQGNIKWHIDSFFVQ